MNQQNRTPLSGYVKSCPMTQKTQSPRHPSEGNETVAAVGKGGDNWQATACQKRNRRKSGLKNKRRGKEGGIMRGKVSSLCRPHRGFVACGGGPQTRGQKVLLENGMLNTPITLSARQDCIGKEQDCLGVKRARTILRGGRPRGRAGGSE